MSTSDTRPGAQQAPAATFRGALAQAFTGRTIALVLGVLLIQLAFIGSYVGAFHAPAPHEIPVAINAPEAMQAQLVDQVEQAAGDALAPSAATDVEAARADLRSGAVSAVFVVNPAGTEDTLYVASGAGASIATAVEEAFTELDASQQRTIVVQDDVPLQAGDARGLTGFYAVTGWIVGGYLLAALLGMAQGARPASLAAAGARLALLAPYAAASGIGGAWIIETLLGSVTGHFAALAALGTLMVLTAGAVTLALQTLAGVLGVGLTVLLFVVLGNPTAGGAYQADLLPPFWRLFTEALPNGAGVDTFRRIAYLGGEGIGVHLVVLAAWLIGAIIATVLLIKAAERRAARAPRHLRRPDDHHAPTDTVPTDPAPTDPAPSDDATSTAAPSGEVQRDAAPTGSTKVMPEPELVSA